MAERTSQDKRIRDAVKLLEKHGYTVTPPSQPIMIDTVEVNRRKLEKRKQDFIEKMRQYQNQYSSDMLNAFYLYWTEPNKSYTKMRFELQRTWDLGLRLNTWNRNNQRRSNGRTQITDADRADKLADILTGEC